MKRKSNAIWEIKKDLPSTETDIIIDNILEWLYVFEANSGRLPQTEDELKYFLSQAQLHKVAIRVDAKVIFYHLLFNRVILIDSNFYISKNPAYDPSSPLLGFVPIDSDKEHISANFTRALNNTIHWIMSGEIVPTQPEDFYLAMEKFCVFTCETSLTNIVQNLHQRQYIVPRFGGYLDYCLPKLEQHHNSMIYEGVPVSLTT